MVKTWTSLWWFMGGHSWTTGEGTRQAATPLLMRGGWGADESSRTGTRPAIDKNIWKSKLALLSTKLIQDTSSKETELVQQQTLHKAITNLFNDPHTPVIINAAITMGEKESMGTTILVASAIVQYQWIHPSQWVLIKRWSQEECKKNKGCYYTCLPCKKCKCVGVCAYKGFCYEICFPVLVASYFCVALAAYAKSAL